MIGLLIGIALNLSTDNSAVRQDTEKFDQTLRLINKYYVDTVDTHQLTNQSLDYLLSKLDPHSIYIPPSALSKITEDFQGNFQGIGIEYLIKNDTINVVLSVPDGPSARSGVISGDRIIAVNDSSVIGITTDQVQKLLRGRKGTKVKLSIFRQTANKTLEFVVIRDKINIYSLDTAFMLDSTIGFIKLNRFSATTYTEFYQALTSLIKEGMQSLILDLRGNPGGYLDQAVKIADEFLDGNKTIVYTMGRDRIIDENYKAEKEGDFEKGKLIILIDQGTASASEIIAGAVQDWDRGVILGTHTFGKGLVQKQYPLKNEGGAVRLTVSRYYTPIGRLIQRDYSLGKKKYYEESALSDSVENSLIEKQKHHQYKTHNGRVVWDSEGIKADIQIAEDTLSDAVANLIRKNVFNDFIQTMFSDRMVEVKKNFSTLTLFIHNFDITDDLFNSFQNHINKNTNLKSVWENKDFINIKIFLKATLARQLWGNQGYFQVLAVNDQRVKLSLQVLKNEKKYHHLLFPE